MEWTPKEIKDHRTSRSLGYKAMGKLLGLKEPKYRHIEFGFDKPDDELKARMSVLWDKWIQPPVVEYNPGDPHTEKQKKILVELGLHKLIRE